MQWFDWFQFTWGTWLLPYLNAVVFAIGILVLIWLIIHVEYGEKFSIKKTIIGIVMASLCLGISTHLFLLLIGLI